MVNKKNKNKLQLTKRHGMYLSRDALAIGRWPSTHQRIQTQILPRPSRWWLSWGWRLSCGWRSSTCWWPWGWYCPKIFIQNAEKQKFHEEKKCKKKKRRKKSKNVKKCKKKVNPNNSVNIEIKGGSSGGPKKNPVPPSPAASKKVRWIND